MRLTANAISQMLDGIVEGDPEVEIHQPSKIEEGGVGTITFLANPKYEPYIYTTTASVVLVAKDFQPAQPVSATLVKVDNVYAAIGLLLNRFEQQTKLSKKGICEKAFVHSSVSIGTDVYVGEFTVIEANVILGDECDIYPQVYIGEGVKLGKGIKIYPGVKIYHNCVIGDYCIIHANCVIGGDGFGFAPQADGTYQKIAQIGNVVLEDQVEIGSNTTIDRATMGSTLLKKGVKIDNLVQIAHNVEIGENTVIASQAGIAGSTKIGANCQIGGQVGFAGHLRIADGTRVQAQSGVAAHVKQDGTALFGSPAIPYTDYIKSYSVFKQLPAIYKKVYELEKKLVELTNK